MSPERTPRSDALEVKSCARELGFDLVGIACAEPFPEEEAAYGHWIGRGMHAGMSYMGGRAAGIGDPRSIHPEARSVVAVAINYYPGELGADVAKDPDVLRGSVARYAWGDDYHAVMKARLGALARFLESKGAGLARPFADTGPLSDRAVAQRAGLGWRGRHSCLITERFGTWIVLGELLTDLTLEPDAPALGGCGSCEACVAGGLACPVGAIVGPGVVDARRCISYWTIEHRGWIPREVRATLAAMVFGCDICQEACPFNQAALTTGHAEFLPGGTAARMGSNGRIDRANPDLRLLLRMTEQEFAEAYGRSALRRMRRSGLRRNAAVALGNSGNPRAVPDLAAALADPTDPLVRGHAAWALGRIGGTRARAELRSAFALEEEPLVRGEIEAALA